MGWVFLVRDRSDIRQECALKAIRPDRLSPKRREAFRNEFQVLSNLSHPNLEEVYDYGAVHSGPGELKDSLFLTCAYVDGTTTDEVVEPGDWRRALELAVPVLRGLQFLHSRGLIHHDVKPGNVVVPHANSEKGLPEPVLIDFGLAGEYRQGEEQVIRGTPGYIAPEIIRGGSVDGRADLYSLGITLCELATGRTHAEKEGSSVLRRNLSSDPINRKEIPEEIPSEFIHLISKLTLRNPTDRPASANKVIDQISGITGQHYEVETEETLESYVARTVFVGREEERSWLRNQWSDVEEGKSGACFGLLEGPAGIGKSRLLREFKVWAQINGKPVLYLDPERTNEQGSVVFGTLITGILRKVHSKRTGLPDNFQNLIGRYGPYLKRIIPTEEPLPNSVTLEDDPTENEAESVTARIKQDVLADNISEFLREMFRERPMILILDDLQKMDLFSRRILISTLRKLETNSDGSSVFFVGAIRTSPEDVPEHFYNQLLDMNIVNSRRLPAMTGDDTEQLVQEILGETKGDIIDLLSSMEGSGNPLFVKEFVRDFLDRGLLQRENNTWRLQEEPVDQLEIPRKVESVIDRRLEQVGETRKHFLQFLAMWQGNVREAHLGELFSEANVPDQMTVRDMEKEGLIRRKKEDLHDDLQLSHDRIGEVIRSNLPEAKKKDICNTVFHNLEDLVKSHQSVDREQHLLRLARLAQNAGLTEKFRIYGREAAERAEEHAVYEEALSLYEDLLQLPDLPEEFERTFLEKAADLSRRMGRFDESRRYYEVLREDPELSLADRVRIVRKQGQLELKAKSSSAAGRLYQDMLDQVPENHISENETLRLQVAGLLKQFGYILYKNHLDPNRADELFQRALSYLENCEGAKAKRLILGTRRHRLINQFQREEGSANVFDQFEDIIETAENEGFYHIAAVTAITLATAYLEKGRVKKGLEVNERAMELNRRNSHRNRRMKAGILRSKSAILIEARKGKDALECLNRSVEVHREFGNKYKITLCRIKEAVERYNRNQYDDAVELLQDGKAHCKKVGDHSNMALADRYLGRCLSEIGKFQEGLEHSRSALNIFREKQQTFSVAATLRDLVIAHAIRGRFTEAENRLDELDEIQSSTDRNVTKYRFHYARGRYLYEKGNYGRSLQVVRKGRTILESLQWPLASVRSRELLARNLAWHEGLSQARASFDAYLKGAEELETPGPLPFRGKLGKVFSFLLHLQSQESPDTVKTIEELLEEVEAAVPDRLPFHRVQEYCFLRGLFEYRFRNRPSGRQKMEEALGHLKKKHVRPLVERFEKVRGHAGGKEGPEKSFAGTSDTAETTHVFRNRNLDSVSGLRTAASFVREGNRLISSGGGNRRIWSLVLFRVHQLEEINRRYGYAEGDRIVSETGRIIEESPKTTFGEQNGNRGKHKDERVGFLAARLGGGEFAVLVSGRQDRANQLGKSIREKIRNMSPGEDEEENTVLSVEMEVVSTPVEGETMKDLLEAAKQKLDGASSRRHRSGEMEDEEKNRIIAGKRELLSESHLDPSLLSRERVVILSALRRITSAGLDFEETLSVTLETAVDVTAARSGFILLHDQDEYRVVSRYAGESQSENDDTAVLFEEAVSRKVVDRAIEEDEGLLIENASEDKMFRKYSTVQRLDLKSVLVVPVSLAGEVSAAIYLENSATVRRFGQEDLNLVEAIAAEITDFLQQAYRYQNQRQQLKSAQKQLRTRYDYDNIVGTSEPMKDVFEVLDRITPSDLNVLIQGETGTGKELVARAIHYNGPRKDQPFSAVNCARFNHTSLESELFGHVEGAFTGAKSDKEGLFEVTDGGTLFLDEITEMEPEVQGRLLRVLEEGTFRRLGGEQERETDVRILSATNRDIDEQLEEGAFREDLFYRLHEAKVLLPPLRERMVDVPLLVDQFLENFAEETETPKKEITDRVVRELMSRQWPGNIRQLKSTVRQLAVYARDRTEITLEDLLKIQEQDSFGGESGPGKNVLQKYSRDHWQDLPRQKKEWLVTRAVDATNGNKSRAAELLDISRQTLYKYHSD